MTRPMMVLVFGGALLLGGCGTGAVYLKHPVTGDVAKCGSYFEPNPLFPGFSECCGALKRLRHCIEDFQAQGYVRLSEDYDEKGK